MQEIHIDVQTYTIHMFDKLFLNTQNHFVQNFRQSLVTNLTTQLTSSITQHCKYSMLIYGEPSHPHAPICEITKALLDHINSVKLSLGHTPYNDNDQAVILTLDHIGTNSCDAI